MFTMERAAINLIIEKENDVFIASSPDINVFAEGKTIEEAKNKFLSGVKFYFENAPEEKKFFFSKKEEIVVTKENVELPMVQRIFL